MTIERALAVAVLAGFLFADGVAAGSPGRSGDAGRKVVLLRDPSIAPVAFAAAEIRTALEANGFSVTEAPLGTAEAPAGAVRVRLAVAGDKGAEPGRAAIRPQGYALRIAGKSVYEVTGADAAGAMYGGLALAEMIRHEKGLPRGDDADCAPAIARRGIKFNIPLDARTPSYDDTGDAAQTNIPHMWDFAFWREFLDDMARHRYNTLTLWNPHPFPSIVKLPNYPDVALDDVCVTTLKCDYRLGRDWNAEYWKAGNVKVVRKIPIDEKIAFWKRVMKHAADRGIDIYLITWNVYVNGAEGKYGITHSQTNPKTIAYLRECVRETIRTYPLLAGIGITAGERMQHRKDEFSKEKWLWKAYGTGVLDAKKALPGREVRFIHRYWQSGVGPIVADFGSKYPGPFELSFKYARAHMYSSTKPPFTDGLCEELRQHKLKCWWNLRNDDIFNFRWGDPDYVREFLGNLPEGLTAGYHMGSDGYVWGRTHTDVDPERRGRLEIRKHWYKFMLWGRLGYDPKLDRGFFEKVLAARFAGLAKPAELYDAWRSASRIIPQVNRFHWRNWDFMWAVEGCLDRPRGFHTVEHFIEDKPMERSGIVSIPQYVDAQLSGSTVAGTTPVQVAGTLHGCARRALALSADVRAAAPNAGGELRETLSDIEAMAHLGDYYAEKILGAVELCAFRKSKDAKRKAAAVEHLTQAVKHWESYARAAASLYRPQLLARTRRVDFVALLEEVKKDVEIARRR
ncbi:MAG: carbohydrate-binding family 6 protein [Phycisphaerae bacterium]